MNTSQIISLYTNKETGKVNINEIAHRFQRTYCAFRETEADKWEPRIIQEFAFSGNKGREKRREENLFCRLLFLNGDSFGENVFSVRDKIRLDIPKMGVFPWRGSVLFSKIMANRNWRRGLMPKSIHFHDPLYKDTLLSNIRIKNGSNQYLHETLSGLYNNKYLSIGGAIEKLDQGGMRAVPISSSFFLCILSNSEDIMVGYKKWIVGKVEENDIGGYNVDLYENEQLREEVDHLFVRSENNGG